MIHGRGFFISVEGGEGVGKSSFCHGLVQALTAEGRKVVQTREPGGTSVAQRIRDIFVNPPSGEVLQREAELCLVSAARAQHVTHVIAPALERGDWVLCDRFADSTRAYQGWLAGMPQDMIESVIALTTYEIEPDLTFLLDCDVDIALKRLRLRQEADRKGEVSRYDAAHRGEHERLRGAYLRVAAQFPQRFVCLDAGKAPEAIVHEGIQVIHRRCHGR